MLQLRDFSGPEFDRRTLLKAAGLPLGGSAASGMPASPTPKRSSPSSGRGRATADIRQPMIGFMLGHEQFRVPQLVQLGTAAEQAGFDLLATSDRLQPWQANQDHSGEAWVTLAALGQLTKSVWIGTTVTCPTFRYHPTVVAEAFASLSLLNPGRIFLGLGSGEALNEHAAVGSWPKWQERSERLIEATQIIRDLWEGEQIRHEGKYYYVNAKLYDKPAKPIPLLMAANGPKAMARAGRNGDGLITDPETWKQHKSEFQNAARNAGKDPEKMPVLVEQFVVVGDRKDAEPAAELWRFLPRAFKTYYNVPDPQTIQQRAEAELPLQQVYSKWPVSTDPEVHVKVINDLFASGVTIVNIHSGQADQHRVIDFYGKQVLPRLRKQRKAA